MPGLPPLPQHFTGFHDQPALVVRESSSLGSAKLQAQFVKKETEWNKEGDSDRKSEENTGDDLISAYMNLDSLDTVNSSGTEEKRDDLDRSENEAESSIDGSVNERFERNEKNKRNTGDDFGEVNNTTHHVRSVSMDSFMGMLNFADELPKLPLSPGARHGHHLRSESMDGTTNSFSLEFGNGEFTGVELNKIMSNEKLAEIAMADPKRAKRILANRQSAARSKERKMRYISELEHRVQILQTEATTLSAQLTLLQRDSAGLASQNNQLKFRLQAMEQQAKLRDALNEALSTELKRLKLSSGEVMSASLMFQLQQQQRCVHASFDQLRSVEEQQNADAVDDEMKQ
ncbi:hypothetical protein HPP92_001349 [Vanilla planifolia]|uniref:BZIP domain-containing protein n=1 Tax=Vanilla planifolia TaxID=51239 RepID=A0A835VJK8_VANPL|nr:hypothetical protein HPP92_001349 [Vanilla planifolia]